MNDRSYSFDDLTIALAAIAAEVRRHRDTAPGQQATSRLMHILARPARRIARDALEYHLERGDVSCEDIEAVATEGLVKLHHFLVTRERDVSDVIRALTILTRRMARCYAQERAGAPTYPRRPK